MPALPYGIRAAEPNNGNHRSTEVRCRAGRRAFLRSTGYPAGDFMAGRWGEVRELGGAIIFGLRRGELREGALRRTAARPAGLAVEAADLIVFLASSRASYISGSIHTIDGEGRKRPDDGRQRTGRPPDGD